MKKDTSLPALGKSAKMQSQLNLAHILTTRLNTEGLRSVRSTNNCVLELIPHEQSFDSILKKYKVRGVAGLANTERDPTRTPLNLPAGVRAINKRKMIQSDSTQTERILKNLQVLK